ncbi:alcohol dehydrogenase [Paraphoma chrysanthemicola]|uniref:Alcohol dehydrogenase n=1 Tax=Paraphoma chrysanthemicola TaxID=798071 RepID=A0A8K0R342_9PLEO|nr:alcohol dehydrogenase [Paraphoma chrysanthemicola]
MDSKDTYMPAFDEPPGTNLAGIPIKGLQLPTPYISSGRPFDDSCAKYIKDTLNASRAYVIASRSLTQNTNELDKLVATIGKDKVVGVRKGITPHSPWSEILSITAECRAADIDCLVTLGAGSITDAAKLIVLCLANAITTPKELARYSLETTDPPDEVKQPKITLICIPTSLSGGEYFSLAGGTDDAMNHKHGFLHSGMGVKLIILDPELCLTTPAYHWLSTGVRGIDHCVEALCSLDATTESDADAKKGLKGLVVGLLKCKDDEAGVDVQARSMCQDAVRYAMGNVRRGIPMGGSHAIGHQLGPLGVPHGITSCIMCPAVMKYNIKYGTSNPEIVRRQDKVKEILWAETDVAKTLEAAGLSRGANDLGDLLDAIIRALGLPRTLTELNISKDKISALAERSLSDFWAKTNPVPLLEASQVQEILEAVL